ncbi:MAG: hypothetical protein R6T83_03315 [Salinibacter sp.]
MTKTVSIVFHAPAGDHSAAHERHLRSVPEPQARQIANDFVEYKKPESDISRYQMYRFESKGEERLMAIDFNDVALITV